MWFADRAQTQTSAWRLTLVFTLVVLLVNAAVLAFVYWMITGEREQQLRSNVLLAAQTYRQLAGEGNVGSEALQRLIASRARGGANTLLALDTGARVVGNLSLLPAGLPQYPATGTFPVGVSDLRGEASVSMALGTVVALPEGRLMVAQLEGDRQGYREQFLLASGVALLVALVLSLAAGWLFNRRVVGRVRILSERMARIKGGELAARLPAAERGDEYDAIARQVNSMLDEIDELVQSLAGVTDNIAHDLRTPLSRIRLRLEEAGGQAGAPPWLEPVIADLDNVIATFESMLELSRLEKHSLPAGGQPCDLQAIADDVVALLSPVAEERGQVLEWRASGGEPVAGDASLLFRGLYNLVDNAIKHAGDGAHIRVHQAGHQVVVSDNGPGIPAAERERVFRRLYRLDQSRNTGGTGLGLSIVRAVAHLHGAGLTLSDNAPGLTVTLDFSPAHKESI